jgi:hypothetical protein
MTMGVFLADEGIVFVPARYFTEHWAADGTGRLRAPQGGCDGHGEIISMEFAVERAREDDSSSEEEYDE